MHTNTKYNSKNMKYCDILKLAFFENYKKYKKENFKHLFNFLISCQFFSSFLDQEKKISGKLSVY